MKTILLLLSIVSLNAGTVTVAWNANPVSENIKGYRVWKGILLLATVTENQATVTLSDYGIQFLSVTAFNDISESPHSSELKVIPLIIEVSNDLGIFTHRKTIYDEVRSRLFYRTPKLNISLIQ